MRSDYKYQYRRIKGKEFIMIEDLNKGGRSVTNDIENIVGEIANREQLIPNQFYIIYKDSDGIWDGYEYKTHTFINLSKSHWLKAAIKMIEDDKRRI